MIRTYGTYGFGEWVRIVVALSKIRISQLVGMSTVLGYVLASGSLSWRVILPALGTFLLSCGSAALNQYQERHYDGLMERTQGRPLPAGNIAPAQGLAISLGLIFVGALTLYLSSNLLAVSLGLFNILWYNGFYTPLKRKSAFAVIPGSLIGAIPPAIGWVAAGGHLLDLRIWTLSLFFFIWQIPHYWLLMMNLSEDYRKAGFPTITEVLGRTALARITFFWIVITGLICLLIPMSFPGSSPWLFAALYGSAVWLVWNSRRLLFATIDSAIPFLAFKGINIYMLVVILALAIDRLFGLPL
ncbi:MAG: protoheme IX farnesyltransferase [Calditrichaeota bacterium]|nr:protoheme IX farnesyltransferase [Calditrichota bacterium]